MNIWIEKSIELANRLIGAVLMDLHEEWISYTRKYINFSK